MAPYWQLWRNGRLYCFRITTFCQLEVSKSFTIPGRICTDAGDYPAVVECRHNVEYIQDNSLEIPGWRWGEGDSSEDGFVIGNHWNYSSLGFLAVLNRGNFNLLSREKEDLGIPSQIIRHFVPQAIQQLHPSH